MKKHYVQYYTKLRLEWINENNDEMYSAGMALIHTGENEGSSRFSGESPLSQPAAASSPPHGGEPSTEI